MANLGAKGKANTFAVVVGTPLVLDGGGYTIPAPITIVAIPGSGGTVLVEIQVNTGLAYDSWPPGTVSTRTINVINGPVYAIKVTALVADAVVGFAQ